MDKNRFTTFLPSSFTIAQGINGLFRVNGAETRARGIADSGQMVGFTVANGHFSGFVGTLDAFAALTFPGAVDTAAQGVDKSGRIVGTYDDGDPDHAHGFIAVPRPH